MLDTLVIGSGPAGLNAAVYAKRANLNVLIAEREYFGIGQIGESSHVDNYLGLPGKSGYELGQLFREHAEKLEVEFYEGEAKSFEKCEGGWKVCFDNGDIIETKTVIYCAGATHRKLGVPGENNFIGRGISYCAVCDGAFFRGRDVAVVGGGNTALDDTLYLSDICNKVYLIHRRKQFRGSPKTLEKIKQKENVEIITEVNVLEINGENTVSEIVLDNGRTVSVDGVFLAVGMKPQTELIKDIVDLDNNGYVIADESGKTSEPGFFVAGDVRTKELRQVVTAVSDGANAVMSVTNFLL